MIPLMIAAGIFTHITARHSVARQQAQQGAMDNPQAAIMQKLMLYVFPIGVVVGAPFLPLAILFYWVSNNLWTLGQQYVVYKKIDAEEGEKREKAVDDRAGARSAARPEAGAPGGPQAEDEPDEDAAATTPASADEPRDAEPATRERSHRTANGRPANGRGVVERQRAKPGERRRRRRSGRRRSGGDRRPPRGAPRKRR